VSHEKPQSERSKKAPSERFPGRKPGPSEREELLRIYDAVGDERRKAGLFFFRELARDAGLVPPETPLMITDGVF